ncbi:MAG: Ribosome-recycling factor [Lentisphaerae bacterium ADurb.Bin242]|nr:MAG: Ribosome-recycling factor [Lentisphaerae bacterium ADurb.Bin242]
MAINDLFDEIEERMMNAEEAMKVEFAGIRTGKASTSLVENIMVEYYGTNTRLRDIAGLATPDSRLITIQPWDQSAVKAIEKAILASPLGISPVSDGKVIRLPIPPLSEERRTALVKQVKAHVENSKIEIRNVRRDGNEALKKAQKNAEITEDELKTHLERVQKLTDSYIAKLEEIAAAKEKELMTI